MVVSIDCDWLEEKNEGVSWVLLKGTTAVSHLEVELLALAVKNTQTHRFSIVCVNIEMVGVISNIRYNNIRWLGLAWDYKVGLIEINTS